MNPTETADTVVKLSDWLTDSYLRSIVISCIGIGILVGFVFSKYTFTFVRWCIERRGARKERERQHQEKEREREIETAKQQRIAKAMEGLEYTKGGVLRDKKKFYCPKCVKGGIRHELLSYRVGLSHYYHCSKCNWRSKDQTEF